MSTLSQLVSESNAIANMIADAGGELTAEIEAALNRNGVELSQKVDGYCAVIDALKRRTEYAEARINEWTEVAHAANKAADRLKENLHAALKYLDLPEISGSEYLVRRQANPPKVVISDEAQIPGAYLISEVSTRVDKKAISECLKNGLSVPGASLERGEKLVMKTAVKGLVK